MRCMREKSICMLCLRDMLANKFSTISIIYMSYLLSRFVLQKDCPSGKLNKKKFIEVYKQFYPTGKAEKFCEYVFRTFDTDGSSNIGNVKFILLTKIQRKN